MTYAWSASASARRAFCSTSRMVAPRLRSSATDRENLVDELGREPHRRLVEEQDLRPDRQRPRDREHLLLAARERPRRHVAARAQDRKALEEPVDAREAFGAAHGGRELQVLLDAHARQHAPAFGHEDQTALDAPVR